MGSTNIPTTGFLAMLFICYPTIHVDFTGSIQDITVYLSHLPETYVNRANIQNIPAVQNRSFMRNKGHVFLCPNVYGQQKYHVGNMSGNIGYIK